MLIEGGCFDLNTRNKELGWDDMSPKKGLKPDQLEEELARLSIERLRTYFKYYYTSHGNKREVAPSVGNFKPALRSSCAIWEDFSSQLQYLLPGEAPGLDKDVQ